MVAETETLLTLREAASLADVSVRSIRNWINEGKIPVVLQLDGKKVRREELRSFLETRHSSPPALKETPSPQVHGVPGLERLVELLAAEREKSERLSQQNFELAGRLGFYQAKLQEAEKQILLLSAPTQVEEAASSPSLPWWKRFLGLS